MSFCVKTKLIPSVGTNCYLLLENESRHAMLVDPADGGESIEQWLEAESVLLQGILLTHGHFDHIGAVDYIRERYHVPVFAHEQEQELLQDPAMNLSYMIGAELRIRADQLLTDRAGIPFAGTAIQVIHTPGHTSGGVCYYLPEAGFLFSGDTLFRGTYGRYDFPTGDYQTLMTSIKETLFVLPDETLVYPGHEQATAIKNEKGLFL